MRLAMNTDKNTPPPQQRAGTEGEAMSLTKNAWSIVKVRRGTPIEGVCTPDQLDTARQHHGKTGYSFTTENPCDEHSSEWIACLPTGCPDCKVEITTYTDADMKKHAIEAAERGCDRNTDCWCVDGDTGEIIAAFRVNIERLV